MLHRYQKMMINSRVHKVRPIIRSTTADAGSRPSCRTSVDPLIYQSTSIKQSPELATLDLCVPCVVGSGTRRHSYCSSRHLHIRHQTVKSTVDLRRHRTLVCNQYSNGWITRSNWGPTCSTDLQILT